MEIVLLVLMTPVISALFLGAVFWLGFRRICRELKDIAKELRR